METFPAAKKRACLDPLSAARLRDLVDVVGVVPASRRKKSDLIAALADGRKVGFERVLEALKVSELRDVCEVLNLDNGGRTKEALLRHVLGDDSNVDAGDDDAEVPSSRFDSVTPPSTRSSGSLKSALRAFVLDVAGGYRGRDAGVKFTERLLECFGWDDGQPPDADVPANLSVVEQGQRTDRQVAAYWKQRRVVIEVTQYDVMLDFAWQELLRTCLQLDPVPQYVILTNQRDLHLYDLARDREAPRLSIAVDDLPKYSEAFPFLSVDWVPGTLPKIINVAKVSKQVADLVAKLYRSLKQQHPDRQRDVIRFTLQCIIAMFAEDIGLLPQEHFTSLLYEGARHGDADNRIAELFRLMSTRDVPGRVVPFFNGGLFKEPVTLHLGGLQLEALTKAAEANWTYVDPHIFGSVFQGVMDNNERHASGAHYTAHEDIMRVVGPTIVEPWRERIRAAKSLTELLACRVDLLKYRVLDPACGSGNFLYVAFRELYRLDTELLARMRDFPSTQGQGKGKVSWGIGVQTSNFFGIDINPFAVELAKVTLNIAKKIAFEERRETAAQFAGQIEMDIDPSLPLDNLDNNIVCKDALFTVWPEADAIVGNPPFLGGLKVRSELGEPYLRRLQKRFPGVNGRADFCSYWFRLAHENLGPTARAGLVGTNSIRDGNTRDASTGYIAANGGTITNAVSSRDWPGDAVVKVSMVNWTKQKVQGTCKLIIGDAVFQRPSIAPHLQLHTDVSDAHPLAVNCAGTSQGVVFGSKLFEIDAAAVQELLDDKHARRFIAGVADATRLFQGRLDVNPHYAIDMRGCDNEGSASQGGKAFAYLKKNVHPYVESKGKTYAGWIERWWQPWRPRRDFFGKLGKRRRIIVCSRHAARPVFVFLSREFIPTESLQLFAFDDDYSFGILQSNLHWAWALAKGTKIKEDTRYTVGVWETFPWPQSPSEDAVALVAGAARSLRDVRARLMRQNQWSIRQLHQAASVAGAHPLKDAQAALDRAVSQAYGVPASQDGLAFLLELNQCIAEDEAEGCQVAGPGLPPGLASDDPRWTSEDSVAPPRKNGDD